MSRRSDLESRLQHADDLRSRGVIDDGEYTSLRRSIISATPASSADEEGDLVLGLGLVGGAAGILFGLFALTVGSFARELGGGNLVIGLGTSALLSAAAGIAAAVTYQVSDRKRLASLGLVVCALWHLISISAFGVPGFVFFVIAGVLGLVRHH